MLFALLTSIAPPLSSSVQNDPHEHEPQLQVYPELHWLGHEGSEHDEQPPPTGVHQEHWQPPPQMVV